MAVDLHLATKDQVTCASPRGHEAARDEREVEPLARLRARRHGNIFQVRQGAATGVGSQPLPFGRFIVAANEREQVGVESPAGDCPGAIT